MGQVLETAEANRVTPLTPSSSICSRKADAMREQVAGREYSG